MCSPSHFQQIKKSNITAYVDKQAQERLIKKCKFYPAQLKALVGHQTETNTVESITVHESITHSHVQNYASHLSQTTVQKVSLVEYIIDVIRFSYE